MPDSVLQTVLTTVGVVTAGGLSFIGVWITAAKRAKADEKNLQSERDVVRENNTIQLKIKQVDSEEKYRDDLQEDVRLLREELRGLKSKVEEWQAKWFELREARIGDQQKIAENERKIADSEREHQENKAKITDLKDKIGELTAQYVKQKQDYEEMVVRLQTENVELRGQVEKHTRRIEILEALMRQNDVPIPPLEGATQEPKPPDAQHVVLKGTMEITPEQVAVSQS